jgi:hypothetical protein
MSVGHRRALFVIAVTAVLAALVPVASVSGATKLPAAWTANSKLPPVPDGWNALSCPTTATCWGLAYGESGVSVLAKSTNGGVSFTDQRAPQPFYATAIACATAQFCVLASPDDGVAAPPNTYVTSNGGAVWRKVPIPLRKSAYGDAYEVSLGCSPTACYLVDGDPTHPLSSITAGASLWSAVSLPTTPDPITSLAEVACGGGRCVAVGTDSYTTGLIVESDAGGAWSETVAPVASVSSVGCSSYACGAFGDDAGYNGSLFWSTTPGTWQGSATASLLIARSVSCTSNSCFAVGGNWDFGGLAAWMLSGVTPTWSTIATPSNENGQVFGASACPTTSTCLAGANKLFDWSTSGSTWTGAKVPQGISGYGPISCSTTARCTAIADLGDGQIAMRTTLDGGTHWTGPVGVTPFEGFSYSLDCVSLTCISTGFGETDDKPYIRRSTDGGVHWSTPVATDVGGQNVGLLDVSCASSADCVAAPFKEPGVVMTTNGGKSWKTAPLGAHASASVAALDCMSKTLCTGVLTMPSGLVWMTSHTGGATWSTGRLTSAKTSSVAESCTSTSVCLLVTALEPSGKLAIFRSTNAGASWSHTGAPASTYASRINGLTLSCWSSTSCEFVMDGPWTEQTFESTTSGRTWERVGMPIGTFGVSIACVTSGTCYGTGADATGPSITLIQHN